jgi:hypothetical protein
MRASAWATCKARDTSCAAAPTRAPRPTRARTTSCSKAAVGAGVWRSWLRCGQGAQVDGVGVLLMGFFACRALLSFCFFGGGGQAKELPRSRQRNPCGLVVVSGFCWRFVVLRYGRPWPEDSKLVGIVDRGHKRHRALPEDRACVHNEQQALPEDRASRHNRQRTLPADRTWLGWTPV